MLDPGKMTMVEIPEQAGKEHHITDEEALHRGSRDKTGRIKFNTSLHGSFLVTTRTTWIYTQHLNTILLVSATAQWSVKDKVKIFQDYTLE